MRAEFESEHCCKVSLHHTFALFDPLKRRQADPGRARTMMARAPVPEICHSLLASNHDARKPLEAWLRLAAVGAAANGAGCAGAHSGSLSNNRVAPVNIDLHVDWRCMPGSGLSPRSAQAAALGVRGCGLPGFRARSSFRQQQAALGTVGRRCHQKSSISRNMASYFAKGQSVGSAFRFSEMR